MVFLVVVKMLESLFECNVLFCYVIFSGCGSLLAMRINHLAC
jgi:hypothetical protein